MIFDGSINPSTILDILQKGGIVGLLVFILFGGYRRWWVFGWQFNKLEERIKYLENSNAKWMEIAFRSTKINEEVTTLIRNKSDESTV